MIQTPLRDSSKCVIRNIGKCVAIPQGDPVGRSI